MVGRMSRSERFDSSRPISLDGRGPHEGLWSVFAVVMIVVAILFVIGVVTGFLVDVAPTPTDSPPANEGAR